MSTLSTKALVLAFASLAVASQACTLASPTTVETKPLGDTDKQDSDATDPSKEKSGSTSSASSAAKCEGKLVKVDVSKLTACGEGKGHCYPKSKTPGGDALKPCDKADEVCVQDTVLQAGGGKLASCKVAVLSNAAGACVALGTMPDDERKQAEPNLKQDSCAAGEVCAPCTNPLENNADTGLCGAIGVTDTDCGAGAASGTTGGASKAAPAAAPSCCGGHGSCAPKSALPESAQDLPQDSCADAANVCIPKALATGAAVKCSAFDGFADGVCLDKCFNDTLATIGGVALSQENCASSELCVPCFAMKQMSGDQQVPGCE